MNTALTPIHTATDTATATEAMLICCALAWHGNPLSGLDYQPSTVERTVTITRHTHTLRQILAWRSHTPPDSWTIRWRWAHRVTTQQFSHAPGLDNLPHDHHDLPAVHTSAPTM